MVCFAEWTSAARSDRTIFAFLCLAAVAMESRAKFVWYEYGFSLLRDEGPQALTLEKLCARAQKTKGSFYHHFKDVAAFEAALLACWQEQYTELPIAQSAQEATIQARARKLDTIVRKLDHVLDTAIRAWSRSDLRVLAVMRKVDNRRMRYLGQLRRDAGRQDPEAIGELEYATFVGLQHLSLSPKRKLVLSQLLVRAIAASAGVTHEDSQ
jgi:AcrR family transcriptional regulator